MRKLSIVLAAIAILSLAGCAGGGGAGGGAAAANVTPYSVDLNAMTVIDTDGNPLGGTNKNPAPFTKNYDDLLIQFPAFPASMNWADYQRVTVMINCYNDGNELIPAADGNAMVSLIYDIKGDLRGPDMGPGPNTPLKEFNVGGGSGTVHRERGSRARLDKAPAAILFQNSNNGVKYIEVTEITFHNR